MKQRYFIIEEKGTVTKLKDITKDLLARWRADYDRDASAHVLNAALAKTDMAELAYVPMNGAKLKGGFSIEVKTRGITAQRKSGRCWMFAALNILRERVAEKCHLEEFELSQNYLTFYDKLEKANNFLEMVIEHASEPLNTQRMRYVLRAMDDGGFWCEAVDLIEKYGVVPKQVNPESYQSEHTDLFLKTINRLLRKDAMELRELVQQGKDPYARKQEMLAEVYKAECIAFGQPVKQFDFAYRDKDEAYHCDRNLTPKAFYEKYVGQDLREYVPIINEPTSDKELHAPVAFHAIENMYGRDMKALNLPQEELEELCLKQLKDGEPIWFACDAGAFGARKEGVWDPASVQYEQLLGGFDLSMPKGAGLEYRSYASNHAVLLTGVNLDADGQPDRWKIENSWGEDVGEKGYFVCSEAYFRAYGYEAVIQKKHLSEEQKQMLEKPPILVNAWDEDAGW